MSHQRLPKSGEQREALRQKGQFWTPEWVARGMVAWLLERADRVFDPAVGAGAFLLAARAVGMERDMFVRLEGRDVDESALAQALEAGLTERDLEAVELRDFLLDPPETPLPAIVANPPYIRHHRLGADLKARLHRYAERTIGAKLDGRAGIHAFFLIRALDLLEPGGRLAFILPADTCEGKYAQALWTWVASKFKLEACVTFDPSATPFPGVDTNALVYFVSREEPGQDLAWVRIHRAGTVLEQLACTSFMQCDPDEATIYQRSVVEALRTGLSRFPREASPGEAQLGAFVRVMRGVATGHNEFFLFTRERIRATGIPPEFFKRTVPRTRHVVGETVTMQLLDELDAKGQPTFLLSLPGDPRQAMPREVVTYLEDGEDRGVHKRVLIGTRNPWYRMESREVPPFLFAYLGRRRARFIRNEAGIVPLTGFLCVYGKPGLDSDELWALLSDEEVVANLSYSGKSYGSGAIKVEPRALESTIVPARLASSLKAEPDVQLAFAL